mgnify:CR=1 FL=1
MVYRKRSLYDSHMLQRVSILRAFQVFLNTVFNIFKALEKCENGFGKKSFAVMAPSWLYGSLSNLALLGNTGFPPPFPYPSIIDMQLKTI